jgi:Trk K+ transport system NAD-binding subunit
MVAAYLYKIVQKPHIRDFISLVNNQAEIFSVVVEDDSEAVGKEINEMGFDRNVLVIAIEREKKLIIPRGDTKIEGGDLLYIFTPQKSLEHVTSLFSGK